MTIEDRDNLGFIDGQIVYGMRLQSIAKAGLGNAVIASTVTTTALKATQREAGANMSVDVQLGSCQINSVKYTEAADVNVVISAAHATDERIDLIVYDQSAGNPAVVAGTPHATDPKVPDVTDDNDIPLALVYVRPQDDDDYTGTIVTGDLYDIRSFVYIGETGKYSMVGMLEIPLKVSTDNNEGSCFSTNGTSYTSAGKVKIALPTNYPSNRTLVARFKAMMMTTGGTAYVELYNVTTSAAVTALSSMDINEPDLEESSELTTGAAANIIDGNVYAARAKSSSGSYYANTYRAWIEFHAKVP